ncbi:ABC transporter substrate-binding protein [Caldivirga maquilingensis]|uniref:Extracellular solute-binding protein family 5 n=1 Tax=Caldivirga maquilingensis (strain ATCC 700844 / DSM 13496 / JCM 10307 / IC-167) TaxID=397948 RepID=A8M999_CALMQ|nr:ABC transporter substrate-binding protein [Caldivirga maquilingensis]ABW02318.1 extracellular solute-binding protein family 5 [Caldivirga maquilingensis IC-167]
MSKGLITKLLILSISVLALVTVFSSYVPSLTMAQTYNITPYNTIYMFVTRSPPATGWSTYNPNIFQGGIWWYGVYQQFLAAVNITTGEFVPLLADNWTMTVLPNGTLEVLVHLRHSGWDNGIPVTCWDVWATNMLLGLVSAMVGNVTVFNNYTCAFMIPKGYYVPLTLPGAHEANSFIALEWGQGIALDWQDSYVWEPIIKTAAANYSWIWLYMFGNSTQKGEAAKVLSTLIHDYLTYKPPYTTGYSNGPYYLCDITPEYFLLCKNPYYYTVNEFKPDYIVEWQYSSMSQVYAALATGKISLWSTWIGSVSPTVIPTITSNPYIKALSFPAFGGDALYFNFLNPWLAMPQVRQAIYYAVNWTQLAQAAYGVGYTYPSPMPQDGLMPYYTNWQSMITSYFASLGPQWTMVNYTYNASLATSLLESVGFTKKNGVWYTPNGSEFTLTLYIGSNAPPAQLTLATEIANALTSFGIPTIVITYPSAEGLTIIKQGKYDLLFSYYSDIYRPGVPYYFPEAFYFLGYPFNYSHWNGIVTLPNGTSFSAPECGTMLSLNCILRVAWAINHDPWYIQIDWNSGIVFLNTQYINWPINDTSIWIGTLQHTTPAWTVLLTHISFKPPVTTTSTTTPVSTVTSTAVVTSTTTVVTSTTVVSGTTTTYTTTSTVPVTATVTSTIPVTTTAVSTVTVTKPVISTTLIIGIIIIVIIIVAAVAAIALRRR